MGAQLFCRLHGDVNATVAASGGAQVLEDWSGAGKAKGEGESVNDLEIVASTEAVVGGPGKLQGIRNHGLLWNA